jgi:hypothetical protein
VRFCGFFISPTYFFVAVSFKVYGIEWCLSDCSVKEEETNNNHSLLSLVLNFQEVIFAQFI